MIPPVQSITSISARLPQRLPQQRFGRKVTCHCCGDGFVTAKPQDPERDTGYGTCEGCRNATAASMSQDGFAGRGFTVAAALTHLSRFA